MRNYSQSRMSNTTSMLSDSATLFRMLFQVYFSMYLNAIKQYGSSLSFPNFNNKLLQATGHIASTAIDVIVAFILALIAALIGVNLIGPVATAVGGALKNGNLTGAANSLTAQITLIFVTVVILGIVVFLALFGKLAGAQAEG